MSTHTVPHPQTQPLFSYIFQVFLFFFYFNNLEKELPLGVFSLLRQRNVLFHPEPTPRKKNKLSENFHDQSPCTTFLVIIEKGKAISQTKIKKKKKSDGKNQKSNLICSGVIILWQHFLLCTRIIIKPKTSECITYVNHFFSYNYGYN